MSEPNKWDDVREFMWVHAPRLMARLTITGPEGNRQPISDQEFEKLLISLIKKMDMYSIMETGKRPY